MSDYVKVKILGCGPTGAVLALALAKVGSRVTIFDPQTAEKIISRSRAYAITHSSRRLFQEIELW